MEPVCWWGYYAHAQPVVYSYGTLFASPHFRRVVILEGGWQPKNGIIIAGPANTSAAALSLSQALLRGFLGGHRLR